MRNKIYKEVEKRCQDQDKQWGGPTHDDTHSSNDWIAFIIKFLGKASHWPFSIKTFRNSMIDVAALAIQAVAWSDRWSDYHKSMKEKLTETKKETWVMKEKAKPFLWPDEELPLTTEHINDR